MGQPFEIVQAAAFFVYKILEKFRKAYLCGGEIMSDALTYVENQVLSFSLAEQLNCLSTKN